MTTLSTNRFGWSALRLMLGLPVLLWAAWLWGHEYAQFFLPLYRAMLGVMLGGFDVKPMSIIHAHEYLIKVDYTIPGLMFIGGQFLPSGLDGSTHVPVYYALTHPVILAAAILAWPGLNWKGRCVRMLASLPVLLALETLDIPLVLYSSTHSAVMQTYDPQGYLASKPMDWIKLLEGGGRYALCIAGAFVAAELQKMTTNKQPNRNRSRKDQTIC